LIRQALELRDADENSGFILTPWMSENHRHGQMFLSALCFGMTIRALIVDDEAPARDELAYLLAEHEDIVAEQAGTAARALEMWSCPR
jgi:hypothetical protein